MTPLQGREGDLPPFFFPNMISYHLNPAQRKFIIEWVKAHKARPSFGAYDKACRQVAKIPTAVKPPVKGIASTKPGFSTYQFVPTSRFDAIKHLPPGWAIASDHDSGSNHRLHNAGKLMLTNLWNYWANIPDGPIEAGIGVFGARLQKQLTANGINL